MCRDGTLRWAHIAQCALVGRESGITGVDEAVAVCDETGPWSSLLVGVLREMEASGLTWASVGLHGVVVSPFSDVAVPIPGATVGTHAEIPRQWQR